MTKLGTQASTGAPNLPHIRISHTVARRRKIHHLQSMQMPRLTDFYAKGDQLFLHGNLGDSCFSSQVANPFVLAWVHIVERLISTPEDTRIGKDCSAA